MTVIRPVGAGDIRQCYELGRTPELTEAFGGPPLLFWIEALAKEGIFFVAEEGGDIVGYIAGERTAGEIAILHNIAVRDSHREKGIGSMLVDKFEQECRGRKLKLIYLYGFSGNSRTSNFFEKKGYIKGSPTHEFEKFL